MSTEIKQEEQKVEAAKPEAKAEVKAEKPAAKAEHKPEHANHKPGQKDQGKGGKKFAGKRPSSLGDNFEERVKIKRISKTTKGGRHMRFSALVIVGDHNGKVGFGIGKANETPNAIKKAVKNARKALVKINMTKTGTVYHEVIGRHGASRVLIKPAPTGTGIIAGSVIRDVLELAGYKDVYTKNLGSNAPLNMVTATIKGLKSQFLPNQIHKARDIAHEQKPEAKVEAKAEVKSEKKETK